MDSPEEDGAEAFGPCSALLPDLRRHCAEGFVMKAL